MKRTRARAKTIAQSSPLGQKSGCGCRPAREPVQLDRHPSRGAATGAVEDVAGDGGLAHGTSRLLRRGRGGSGGKERARCTAGWPEREAGAQAGGRAGKRKRASAPRNAIRACPPAAARGRSRAWGPAAPPPASDWKHPTPPGTECGASAGRNGVRTQPPRQGPGKAPRHVRRRALHVARRVAGRGAASACRRHARTDRRTRGGRK